MSQKRHILANKIKEKVLAELFKAKSAIDINDVDVKYPYGEKDGDEYWQKDSGFSIHCYIKVRSLKTIDKAMLNEIVKKYSINTVNISYVINENRIDVYYEEDGINYSTSEQMFMDYSTSEQMLTNYMDLDKKGISNCFFMETKNSMAIYITVT